MSANDFRPLHVKYVAARRNGFRMRCTCGLSHGARSWATFDSAVKDPELAPFVKLWINDPMVSRICREYAERGTGIESLRKSLAL